MAKWWYNTTYHTTIQMTLFEALYVYKPSMFSIGSYGNKSNTIAGSLLEEKKKIAIQLNENLQKAHQDRMK